MGTSIEATGTNAQASVRPADEVHVATVGDAIHLAETLTLAFCADPPARWLFPDADQFLRCFPDFVRAFGGRAVDLGTAHYVGGFAGCASWLPPGEGPDEAALIGLIERSVPPCRQGEVLAVFEAMDEAHPTEPHWYLPLIGVDTAFQGRGIGSKLLRHGLAACDRDGLPAYLEATSPRNVPLYERHGFRRLRPLRVGSCPPITPMLREPA